MSSSVNPEELSLTVTAGARAILALATALGYANAVDAESVLAQIPIIVLSGYATWQAVETVWGVVRKIIVKFSER